MDEWREQPSNALAPMLAAFAAVAAESHVTRAAQLLGIPQSTLSRRLHALEDALGVALFRPSGRGIALTPAGHDLLERTRGTLRTLEEAVAAVTDDADADHGLVRFGFPLTLGPASVPSMLAEFNRLAPGIRLHLTQAHGEALTAALREGRLDLAVVIPIPPDLPVEVLGQQRIDLYVSRDHRLAGRRRVSVAELADEAFIANPPSYHLRSLLELWCEAEGFTPRVAFEITEFETLRALVAHGLGVALLPAPETPHSDVVEVPLTGSARSRDIGLVSSSARLSAPAARLHAHIASHGIRASPGLG